MKRFKIGFVAVIAILAMSFTVASKSNVLGNKLANAAVEAGCYTSLTVDGSPYTFLHTAPPNNTQNIIVINDGTTGANPGSSRKVDDPDSECNSTTTFCCYDIDANGTVLSVRYKV
jgi:hypothetical protein